MSGGIGTSSGSINIIHLVYCTGHNGEIYRRILSTSGKLPNQIINYIGGQELLYNNPPNQMGQANLHISVWLETLTIHQ